MKAAPAEQIVPRERCIYMSKQEQIRRLWKDGFGDSREYTDMYFSRIYDDENVLTISNEEGRVVSCIQMAHYDMLFAGQRVGLSYFGGAITDRRYRGRGYMSRLMLQAMDKAVESGAMMCALIPAHDWLYFFFDRFGFSTVYLADRQCFTSFHPFNTAAEYVPLSDPYSDQIFEAFARFEESREGGVLHSHRDFINILDELSLRKGGTFVAVGRHDVPVAGMAWAVDRDRFIQVNELLGVDDDARTAALRELRKRFPDRQFTVLAPAATAHGRHLYARGMGRIINAGEALRLLAQANPKWKSAIRIHDPFFPQNCHTFVVADGACTVNDAYKSRLDFDISIDVFTRVLFSSPSAGDILGFPCHRTHISLMPH